MEINNITSAVSAYNKIGSGYKSAKSSGKTAAGASKNVDKVEFSSAVKANSIDSAKAAVKKVVDSDASTERISALKAKIAGGAYNVSAENVASAILEG